MGRDQDLLTKGFAMSRLLVTQYQTEVEKIIQYGGSKKETSIRNAFERLLNDYCKPRNYLLIPELDFKTKFNQYLCQNKSLQKIWQNSQNHPHIDV